MALDPNKLTVQSDNFQGGLVTMIPPHLLDDGATPSCANVDFSRSYGRLTKRRGRSLLVDGGSKGAATGLYEYIQASGTIKLFLVSTRFIDEAIAPSTLTERWNSGVLAQSVSGDIMTGIVTVTAGNHTFSTGNTINFSIGTWLYGLNGSSHVITVVDANTFTVNGVVAGSTAAVANPGSVSTYEGPTGLSLGETNFVTFDDTCIAVSPTIATLKSTGTTFTILLGTPPANAHFIETHKGKVFIARHGGGQSRLSWSATDAPEDWTTIIGAGTDAGFDDVGLDDGDVITGIKSIGSVLLIFKNSSTWIMSGNDTTDFKFRKISPSIGCTANRTIVSCDTFAIFLSPLGVYSANSDGVTMLSYNVKPTMDAWTPTLRQTACAGRLNTQYWIAINEDGTGNSNEVVYYLDYVLGVWGRYTQMSSPNVFITRRDGTLLCGMGKPGAISAGPPDIYTLDTGTEDGVTAITMTWDSPDYGFEAWEKIKHPLDIIVSAKAISGKAITITHLVDGAQIGTTLSFDLTPSGSKNKAFFLKRSFPSTSYGRYIGIRFTNSEAAAPIEIFSFNIRASVDERQQG